LINKKLERTFVAFTIIDQTIAPCLQHGRDCWEWSTVTNCRDFQICIFHFLLNVFSSYKKRSKVKY